MTLIDLKTLVGLGITDFYEEDLSNLDLTGMDLRGLTFFSCDFTNTNLKDTDTTDTGFEYSNVRDAKMYNTKINEHETIF